MLMATAHPMRKMTHPGASNKNAGVLVEKKRPAGRFFVASGKSSENPF